MMLWYRWWSSSWLSLLQLHNTNVPIFGTMGKNEQWVYFAQVPKWSAQLSWWPGAGNEAGQESQMPKAGLYLEIYKDSPKIIRITTNHCSVLKYDCKKAPRFRCSFGLTAEKPRWQSSRRPLGSSLTSAASRTWWGSGRAANIVSRSVARHWEGWSLELTISLVLWWWTFSTW